MPVNLFQSAVPQRRRPVKALNPLLCSTYMEETKLEGVRPG